MHMNGFAVLRWQLETEKVNSEVKLNVPEVSMKNYNTIMFIPIGKVGFLQSKSGSLNPTERFNLWRRNEVDITFIVLPSIKQSTPKHFVEQLACTRRSCLDESDFRASTYKNCFDRFVNILKKRKFYYFVLTSSHYLRDIIYKADPS